MAKPKKKSMDRKGQYEHVIVWLIIGLLMLGIGLYFLYVYFKPGTDSALETIFGR